MTDAFERHLRFNSVVNFRDIGGYRGHGGKTVAWRRIFRSGEFRHLTREDLERITGELGIVSVIDLRSNFEVERVGNGLLNEADIKHHGISFMTDGGNPDANARRYSKITSMGEFYVIMVSQKEFGGKIVEALEVIADPSNHPLVFHCAVGKDRTGILAASLLSLLGVKDADIIEDYALSEPYMNELEEKIKADPSGGAGPRDLPDFFWRASPDSMKKLLDMLKKEYGSVEQYLKDAGMAADLPERLRSVLLD